MANCFSAACRKGAPTSKFLPAGAPVYNATCYCPYVTTRQPFLMSSADYPCGPANASMVKPSTLIYNGGWLWLSPLAGSAHGSACCRSCAAGRTRPCLPMPTVLPPAVPATVAGL